MNTLRTLALFALAGASLQATPVSMTVGFLGGLGGTWTVGYASGDPAVQLQSVVINLGPGLIFDPTAAAPGTPAAIPFLVIAGAGTTGFTGQSGDVDGGTVLTLNFSDFDGGETFIFELDIDETAALQDCSGLGGILLSLCTANNVGIGVDNATVDASEFSGTISATFGGPGFVTTTLSSAPLSNVGGPLNLTSAAYLIGEVEAVPEPGTLSLTLASLAALGLRRRWKQSS